MFQDELQVHKTINFSNCNLTTTPDNSDNMFFQCDALEKIIAKNVSSTFALFLQSRLVLDIPDRCASDKFTLVLDDGNYRLNKENSEWIKIS